MRQYSDNFIKARTDANILSLASEKGFSKTDIACFKAARDAALTSDYGTIRIGCVLFYKGSIIGCGANMSKSDPEQQKYNLNYRHFHYSRKFSTREHSIHAEMAALKSVPYAKSQSINWSKVKAYVFRISPGKPSCQGLSKPCPACSHALYDKGIKNVYFSDDNGFGRLHFSDEIMQKSMPHQHQNWNHFCE